MREPCLLCHGPEQLRVAGIDLAAGAPLCCGHGWQLGEMWREHQRRHPDDRCTDTCGCTTFEELEAQLALRDGLVEG